MISYSRGDVILVDIAFSGAVGHKRRPAVVVSTDAFNTAGIKLINVILLPTDVTEPSLPQEEKYNAPMHRR